MGALVVLLIGGGLLAAYARSHTFVLMWAAGIQLTFSVFLSVMLCPTVVEMVPGSVADPYYYAAALFCLALILFLAMFATTRHWLPRLEELRLPTSWDQVGAVVVGFLTGVLLTSFFLFVLYITPLSQEPFARPITGREGPAQIASFPVRAACRAIGYLSFQTAPEASESVMRRLASIKDN